MRRIASLILVLATVLFFGGFTLSASRQEDKPNTTQSDIKIPYGYRDWKLISVAHEAGSLNDIRAIVGNDLAIEAYRNQKKTFPDGTIIARIAWSYVPSEENNKAFGREQSFVAGPPTNVQFMVKDAIKYAATGGWGFAQFTGGKSANEAVPNTCFSCHKPVNGRDFVFTRYAP